MTHTAKSIWQERKGEVSWRCSCGALNKHIPLPAHDLCCIDDTRARLQE